MSGEKLYWGVTIFLAIFVGVALGGMKYMDSSRAEVPAIERPPIEIESYEWQVWSELASGCTVAHHPHPERCADSLLLQLRVRAPKPTLEDL